MVYYVLSGDYNLYMDKQHAINTEIYRRFAEENIPFALSTRTLAFKDEPLKNEPVKQEPVKNEPFKNEPSRA